MATEFAADNTERPCIPLADLPSSIHQSSMKPPFVICRKLFYCIVFRLPFHRKMSRWQQWTSYIRDPICHRLKNQQAICNDSRFQYIIRDCAEPVSYTHLTLPTSDLV